MRVRVSVSVYVCAVVLRSFCGRADEVVTRGVPICVCANPSVLSSTLATPKSPSLTIRAFVRKMF